MENVVLDISTGGTIIGVIVAVLVIGLILANIKIVPQATTFIIERLGTYRTTWDTGLHLKVPFIDRVAKKISLKEKVADFAPQAVITKDNVTMQIDTVLFYQIVDPKLYTYGIERPIVAIENLSATTLRNIIGDLELDQTLTSRDIINTRMREILDEATDPWGIKVNRVELKNIIPPKEIQAAMEKQMKAEREKREKILKRKLPSSEQKLRSRQRSEKLKVRLRLSSQFRKLQQRVFRWSRMSAQTTDLSPSKDSRLSRRSVRAHPQRSSFLQIFRASQVSRQPSRKLQNPDIRTVTEVF